MKRKMIFAVLAFLLILQVQTVFAELWNTQEVAFLNAFRFSDLDAMEKALHERTDTTNINVLLDAVLRDGTFNNEKSSIISAIQLLIRYGADCNNSNVPYYYMYSDTRGILGMRMSDDISPLASALWRQLDIQVIRLLLESGANPNMYPQFFPVRDDNRIAISRLLIENGYNVNSIGIFGYEVFPSGNYGGEVAPLYAAAYYGSFASVRLLVESGAKINQQYSNGKTAAQIAYEKGEIDIYNYLKQKGATWTAPSQVASAPPPSSQSRQTYNDSYDDYSPPPSSSRSSSSSSSSGSSWADVGKSIAEAFTPPLDSGTYGLSGTQAKIRLTGIAKSGMLSYTNKQGKTVNGYYNIDGNRMTVQADGFTYVYTITSKTSFSGHGETWVRTGY